MSDRAKDDSREDPTIDPTGTTAETLDSGFDGDDSERPSDGFRFMESTAERYELGDSLGEGGMALVHLATDQQLGRQVALKRLRPELADNPNARARFFDEAQIMASLDHPGSVPVFDAGTTDQDLLFYAMKKVSGETLKELLAGRTDEDLRSRHSVMHFVDIFEKVCQTVAAAHDELIIHRDLKPENIMVDDLGVVYVMDWGIAKRLPKEDDPEGSDISRTRLGAVMGTPAYMAPEQASGHSATTDCQADVFSLGILLYEILTGRNPFASVNARESMKGVMYHEPDPPRKVNRSANRSLSAVCMKALQKDPFKRYKSARELAEDIQRFREHLPVSAIKPRFVDRVAAWANRHPTLATVLATLAVVGLAGTIYLGVHASIENTMVSRAYERIEEAEARLVGLNSELSEVEAALDGEVTGDERTRLKLRRNQLIARREVNERARMDLAIAILGFTIYSPDARAQEVVKQSLFADIDEHLNAGDLDRAEAAIRLALYYSEGENRLASLSDEEIGKLEGYHEDVMEQIKARESEIE